MAQGIAFCLEQDHADYISPQELSPFKDWLVGSDWIAALSKEPDNQIKEIIEHFEIKQVLVDSQLYHYSKDGLSISPENKIKDLSPLQSEDDFENALKQENIDVLLFGSKEEVVGMASMDRWLDYFEALEIL